MIAVDNIKWSDCGKRVTLSVAVYATSGFWGDQRKAFSWKCFVMGDKANLTRFFEREEDLAKIIASHRETWLSNVGKRYYRHMLEGGLSLCVWIKSYEAYE